jgi:regulation of enolase protein 1 (concanavalin A-like superfamily)
MKKVWLIVLLGIAVLSSCRNTEIENGEACSIKVSGVEFTKSLNDAKSLAAVTDGKLIFKCRAKNDNFNDPDGKLSNSTAPVLLTKIDNSKPFTFIAKVTPSFNDMYDAGTMYIYLNSKQWFKFAFERDERKRTRMVTVRTIETSDDNNHDPVDSASVFMKMSSDTKTIGFYYSLDKENWQLVRLFRNAYPTETWIGVSTQSPIGNGTSATFEECSLTQSSVKDFRMGR